MGGNSSPSAGRSKMNSSLCRASSASTWTLPLTATRNWRHWWWACSPRTCMLGTSNTKKYRRTAKGTSLPNSATDRLPRMSCTWCKWCRVTPSTPVGRGAGVWVVAAGVCTWPTIFAGLPTTMALGGTERVTTAPAPTIACAPTVMPGSKVALAPIDAPWRTTVRAKASGRCRLRGKRSLLKVALGPTNTSDSSRMPSHRGTPLWMVTPSASHTSFSMKTWSQTLQSAPILAPGKTWAKAQMRVPAPTAVDSHRACGWTKKSGMGLLAGVADAGRAELLVAQHHGQGPRLGVFVGAPGVGADDAQAEQVQRAKENDRQHDHGIAGHSDGAEQLGGQHGAAHPPGRQPAAQDGAQQAADGQVGEGGNAAGHVPELFAQRPCRHAMLARLAHIGQLLAAKTQPEHLRDQRAMALLQLQQAVPEGPVAGKHIPPAGGDFGQHVTPVKPPENLRRQARGQRLVARLPHADDHIAIGARQGCVHAQHQLGRPLQVGRQHGKIRSAGPLQRDTDGGKRAEVARQQHQARAQRAVRQSLAQDLVAAVRAAIDHEHGFHRPLQPGVQRLHGCQQVWQAGLVAVHRDQQREHLQARAKKERTAALTRSTSASDRPG